MFEFIRTHQRLMQLILLLLIFPSFAFFGLESYTRFQDGGNTVAKVAGQSITQQEWDAAQREQMERFRQMFGGKIDPKMFDTPQAKQNVLDNLIAQKALAAEAAREHLSASDQTLRQTILGMEGLTTADGKFDSDRYKMLLAAQGMTPTVYEARLRQELAVQQVNAAVQSSGFAPRAVVNRIADLNDQEREVQQMLFKTADYASQVQVTDAMLKDYYNKHGSQFTIPEQVRAEYVVLDNDAVASQIKVSDDDIKSYYEQNKKHYTVDEQRRASHILIAVKKDASAADKAAAKAKAEKLLAQVRKNPAEFAKLAKENSQDPGSAEKGGDLGYFSKGMMVKPFEEAVFKLKDGEISDLVQTDFGFHIIQLTGVKPGSVKPFDEVKGEIAAEIKKQLLAKKYAELAEIFSNTVYEQADSLKPVADKLKLKIQTVDNLTRQPNPSVAPNAPYNDPKFLTALFSDEAIKNHHNTEAIQVAPNTLISGHVVEHKPATQKPFEEVRAIVRERVVQEEATKLAKQAGEAKLAALKAKDNAAGFTDTKKISRAKHDDIDNAAFNAVMKADVTKLPTYTGVELPHGFAIYRIVKIDQPVNADAAKRQAEQQQVNNVVAAQETYAYLQTLKQKAKVKILKPMPKAEQEDSKTAGDGTEK